MVVVELSQGRSVLAMNSQVAQLVQPTTRTAVSRQATSIATPMAWVTSFPPVGAQTAPVAFSGRPVAHGSSLAHGHGMCLEKV